MTWQVFLIVISAAFFHALWNLFVKTNENKLLALNFIAIISCIICLPFVFFSPFPSSKSLPLLILSVFLHLGYNIYLAKSYKFADLSLAYPIARGSAPLMVTIGGAFFANEYPSFLSLVGIALTSMGIILLAANRYFNQSKAMSLSSSKNRDYSIVFALITGLFIASYTLTDAVGVRLSNHTFSYIIWLFVLEGIASVGVSFAIADYKTITSYLSNHHKKLIIGALFSLTAYGLVIYAMSISVIGEVSALRETSVVFATLLGVFYLKEKVSHWHWLAVLTVTTGIIIMMSH